MAHTENKENNPVLDLIITLINYTKADEGINSSYRGKRISLGNASFISTRKIRGLLGEAIRLYRVTEDHLFISRDALKLWSQISGYPIWNYNDDQMIKCFAADPVILPDNTVLEPGKSIQLKKIITTEHITDVKSIITELTALKEPDHDSVFEVLEKIRLARVLRSEAKRIRPSQNRGTDFRKIYTQGAYKDITLIDYYGNEVPFD